MPQSKKTPWLLCYDISDPKRLQRVHRVISSNAVTLQYSVFYAYGTRTEVFEIIEQAELVIDSKKDDLRAYPILTTAQTFEYGCSMIPDNISLLR